MPVLCFRSNIVLSPGECRALLHDAAESVERLLCRESCKVMASYETVAMLFDGSPDPMVFTEFQCSEPLGERSSGELCRAILDIFNRYTEVDASRVYLNLSVVNKSSAWKFIDGCPVCPGCRKRCSPGLPPAGGRG